MKLKISRHDPGKPGGKAFVETENVQVVADYATVDGEHLKLGYDNKIMVDIHVGDWEKAVDAENAVRRAIQYNETWTLEEGCIDA